MTSPPLRQFLRTKVERETARVFYKRLSQVPSASKNSTQLRISNHANHAISSREGHPPSFQIFEYSPPSGEKKSNPVFRMEIFLYRHTQENYPKIAKKKKSQIAIASPIVADSCALASSFFYFSFLFFLFYS